MERNEVEKTKSNIQLKKELSVFCIRIVSKHKSIEVFKVAMMMASYSSWSIRKCVEIIKIEVNKGLLINTNGWVSIPHNPKVQEGKNGNK